MMQINLLGLSGKKQAGKDTAANYIVGLFLKALRVCENFEITDKGKLLVHDLFGEEEQKGILDMSSKHPDFLSFAKDHIFPFVRVYSFADLLKEEICIKTLGLTREQCYGTDEQKNSLTNLYWENMPGIICDKNCDLYEQVTEARKDPGSYPSIYSTMTTHEPGQMTAREVMQFVGTEIFRKMYAGVWVEALLRRIKKESPMLAIVADVRFLDELDSIETAAEPLTGKTVRLARDIHKGKDQHPSETALDDLTPDDFSCYIDNQEMSIEEQNQKIKEALEEWKWLPQEIPNEVLESIV